MTLCNVILFLYNVSLYSFSIDDGTSSAFVSCSDRQVAELLDLTVDQWTDLEELVQPLGHVSYELVGIASLVLCDFFVGCCHHLCFYNF